MSRGISVKLEDIPKNVLVEVKEKWLNVLKTGWKSRYWTNCALCDYLNELVEQKDILAEDSCEICPLWDQRWCRNVEEDSRLHPLCYPYGQEDDEWRKSVQDFIDMISATINKKTSEKII